MVLFLNWDWKVLPLLQRLAAVQVYCINAIIYLEEKRIDQIKAYSFQMGSACSQNPFQGGMARYPTILYSIRVAGSYSLYLVATTGGTMHRLVTR